MTDAADLATMWNEWLAAIKAQDVEVGAAIAAVRRECDGSSVWGEGGIRVVRRSERELLCASACRRQSVQVPERGEHKGLLIGGHGQGRRGHLSGVDRIGPGQRLAVRTRTAGPEGDTRREHDAAE